MRRAMQLTLAELVSQCLGDLVEEPRFVYGLESLEVLRERGRQAVVYLIATAATSDIVKDGMVRLTKPRGCRRR